MYFSVCMNANLYAHFIYVSPYGYITNVPLVVICILYPLHAIETDTVARVEFLAKEIIARETIFCDCFVDV